MRKIETAIAILLWIIIITAVALLLTKNPIGTLQKLLNPSSTDTSSAPVPSPDATPEDLIRRSKLEKAIENAINNKKYKNLTPFMETKLEVKITTKDCCGSIPPNEAVVQIPFIEEGLPLNFNQ